MDLKERIALVVANSCDQPSSGANRILSLVREEIQKHQLTDDERRGVDEPCLRDEPCSYLFGIADEPCDAEGNEDGRCVLCHERELTIAQTQSILKAFGGE